MRGRNLLIFAGVLFALVCVVCAGLSGLYLYAASLPQPAPTPEPIAVRQAWVNRIASCPDDPEYGDLIAPTLNMYSAAEFAPNLIIAEIPHGAQIDVISETDVVIRARWNGIYGWLDPWYTVNYDPANGVQPDTSKCLS